ncbi:MAG: prepilin-type N-terminal cleavage/methylation domain-containing protein [Thiogranum sp.]
MQRCSRGISLIEALITLLVLSIGLLGLGQLQARLWSGSSRLHATGNAYLLGSQHLEIMLAKQSIRTELIAEPPMQVGRAGTLFNATVSFRGNEPLGEAEARIEWQNRNGPEAVSLKSIASTIARTSDARLLLSAYWSVPSAD